MSKQHDTPFGRVVRDLGPLLDRLGVTDIEWSYSGSGDSGAVDTAVLTPERHGFVLPHGLLDVLESKLEDNYPCYDGVIPSGYEINEGSFGMVSVDVKARTYAVDINDNEPGYDDDDEYSDGNDDGSDIGDGEGA